MPTIPFSSMTIFALATPPGKAGVAILRISGTVAKQALEGLGMAKLPPPRMASFAKLYHPTTRNLLDEAIVLWFPAPHSFTGEDVVELQVHGSRAVVHTLLEVLGSFKGMRMAEPGEFARRAFQNGKMDLTQAEGLADLIDAETKIQAGQALRQMQGLLKTLYEGWREQLIHILAHVEAYIDFPDEDIPPTIVHSIEEETRILRHAVLAHMEDDHRGERIREGLHAVILGAPNVGKSSLLNYLAKRDVAIVSHIAGTTRDVIDIHLDLDGYPLVISDTAGLRETADIIEQEGIKRATHRAREADVKIVLLDGSMLPSLDEATTALIDDASLVVINKADLVSSQSELPTVLKEQSVLSISVETGEGMDQLLRELKERVEKQLQPSHSPLITRARHREALQDAIQHLQQFSLDLPVELAAEELRLASYALGRITGRIDIETILDEIFRQFCIGK